MKTKAEIKAEISKLHINSKGELVYISGGQTVKINGLLYESIWSFT